jgi:hypothetical protein
MVLTEIGLKGGKCMELPHMNSVEPLGCAARECHDIILHPVQAQSSVYYEHFLREKICLKNRFFYAFYTAD